MRIELFSLNARQKTQLGRIFFGVAAASTVVHVPRFRLYLMLAGTMGIIFLWLLFPLLNLCINEFSSRRGFRNASLLIGGIYAIYCLPIALTSSDDTNQMHLIHMPFLFGFIFVAIYTIAIIIVKVRQLLAYLQEKTKSSDQNLPLE